MTFQETMLWQRWNAPHINWLARQGDKLALRLIESYRILYADQLNPYKQGEFMRVADDYVRRDHLIVTRSILQSRYGYKIPRDFRRLQ